MVWRQSFRFSFRFLLPVVLAALLLIALLLLSGLPAAQAETAGASVYSLFTGTALNPTGSSHSVYEVDVANDVNQSIFGGRAVWGATYDSANNRVLFTSDGGIGGDALYSWSPGQAGPTLVGNITDATGAAWRIDGLAISGGVLYGSRAAASTDGIFQIDMGTLVATLVLPTTNSISGIDADPETGIIYGVNDTTGQLVEIDVAGGTITNVAAYPDPGEGDLDGIAVGNGRAYLIPDDGAPGLIYVYNIATGMYETPLTAPWSGSDTFSGGAFIFPTISMSKTVGMDPSSCATTDTIDVPAGSGGTQVTYCYSVQNTGVFTVDNHTVVDDQLGTLLSGLPLPLAPGQGAFFTVTTNITQTTVNSATWTADDGVTPASASDTATVNQLPPTGVSLSGFGAERAQSLAPLWLGLLLLLLAGTALLLRRRPAS